jgi:hypothetical protein
VAKANRGKQKLYLGRACGFIERKFIERQSLECHWQPQPPPQQDPPGAGADDAAEAPFPFPFGALNTES